MDKVIGIVGIDPGTTTAIVILDIYGNVIFSKAKKNYDVSEIIKDIKENCKPVLIATDKSDVPKTVKRISSILEIGVFSPKEDLPTELKKEFLQDINLRDKRAEHVLDAISAARYAIKKNERMIKRAIDLVNMKNKPEMLGEVLRLVFRHEGLNPYAAYEILKINRELKKGSERKRIRKRKKIIKKEEIDKEVLEYIRFLEKQLIKYKRLYLDLLRKKEIRTENKDYSKLEKEIEKLNNIIYDFIQGKLKVYSKGEIPVSEKDLMKSVKKRKVIIKKMNYDRDRLLKIMKDLGIQKIDIEIIKPKYYYGSFILVDKKDVEKETLILKPQEEKREIDEEWLYKYLDKYRKERGLI